MQAEAPEAVDLAKETEATKELYGLDEKETAEFGRMCLLSRRLVERGVRFVQLYSGAGSKWDSHAKIEKNHRKLCRSMDKPVAGLLQDLKARGLARRTLVVWGGEFGRTPMSEKGDGRDHNPTGFTMWMAGGGVKGGQTIGATDELGLHAVEDRLHVHDLHATILWLLGLDNMGLDLQVQGPPRAPHAQRRRGVQENRRRLNTTLSSLRIRNLALVEELGWQLRPGFTVVTGETGSGKSIIVGALKLILGERADKALLRTGAESCTVEAVFDVRAPGELNARLEEQGVEPCEDGQLLVKRVFTAAGANRQFINGSPATLSILKELGEALVDLHGPHDHQSLLSSEKQLALLDSYAGAEALRTACAEHFRRHSHLISEHRALASNEAALERELDLLRHQVREIEAAQLREGEEEELLARYAAASNGRRLLELSTQALARLAEADDAILHRLTEIGRLLRDLERIDSRAGEVAEGHARGVAELEEVAAALQRYADQLDLDPARLTELEDRVSLFETLKRKYGGSMNEVIAFGAQAAERLRKIESRGDELARLEKEIKSAEGALREAAGKLTRARRIAAPKLASSVTAHLRDLGFKKSEFAIELKAHDEPSAHGGEAAEFLFAPNPGEPLKALKAIASSGEISRVMLAIKSTLAAQDTVSLLVFDEIDANVGGEIAHAVGAKMQSLGHGHQVLCISHLPQVAARADAQFVVTKEYANERTVSQLHKVEGKARVEEIARMLGGKGASALAHARVLLEEGG